MQVGFNNSNFLNDINQKKNEQTKAINNLSSGEKDKVEDPAMAMIARMMMSDIMGDSQGLQNAHSASAMMKIADSALTQASEMATHLQELSVASNNAALGSQQQNALQSEFNATVESINMTFSSATFNGKSMFGESMSFSFNSSEMSISLSDMNTDGLSLNSMDSIEQFTKNIQDSLSNVGSTQNSINSEIENLLESITQKSFARSQMADADIAEEVTKFQSNQLQIDASLIAQSHQKEISAQRVNALLN
jgi:flagellin